MTFITYAKSGKNSWVASRGTQRPIARVRLLRGMAYLTTLCAVSMGECDAMNFFIKQIQADRSGRTGHKVLA